MSESYNSFFAQDLQKSSLIIVHPPPPIFQSHFSEGLYRKELGQIGILDGNWHFRRVWIFSGGIWKLPVLKKVSSNLKQKN